MYTELIYNKTLLIYPPHYTAILAILCGIFSSSKTVPQHTVRIRQSSYCSVMSIPPDL